MAAKTHGCEEIVDTRNRKRTKIRRFFFKPESDQVMRARSRGDLTCLRLLLQLGCEIKIEPAQKYLYKVECGVVLRHNKLKMKVIVILLN